MKKSTSISHIWLLSLSGLCGSVAHAGTVSVDVGVEPGTLSVLAKDASVPEILVALAKHAPIEVQGASDAAAVPLRSGRWQGTVEQILARALDSGNYMISRPAAAGAPHVVVLLPGGQSAAPGHVASSASRAATGTTGSVAASAPEAPNIAADAGAAPGSGLGVASASAVAVAAAGDPRPGAADKGADGEKSSFTVHDAAALSQGLALANGQAEQIAQQFEPGAAYAPSSGTGGAAAEPQGLTQQVAVNAQALAGSLRAICLGNCGR